MKNLLALSATAATAFALAGQVTFLCMEGDKVGRVSETDTPGVRLVQTATVSQGDGDIRYENTCEYSAPPEKAVAAAKAFCAGK